MASDEPASPLHAYFAAFDAADFETVANMFVPDALFIRPRPLVDSRDKGPPAMTVDVFEGRDAIKAFLTRRGKASHRHQITHFASTDKICFAQGVVLDPQAASLFVCSAELLDGLFTRYTLSATWASLDDLARSGLAAEASVR